MISINIKEEVSSKNEMVKLLDHIANEINEGKVKGFFPSWELKDPTERERKTEYIEKVIRLWGGTTSKDLQLESSPIFNGINFLRIEGFYDCFVTVVEYRNDVETDRFDVPYRELDDDLINEIHSIIQKYENNFVKVVK